MSLRKLFKPQLQLTLLVYLAEGWGLYLLLDAYDMPGTYIVPLLTVALCTILFLTLFSNTAVEEITDAESLKLAFIEVGMRVPGYGVVLFILVALVPTGVSFLFKQLGY